MQYSIVPEIIAQKKIIFLDEQDVRVNLCKSSPFKYISPFEKPYIVVDTFAKKTSSPEEVINLEIDELKKLGFMITTTPAGRNRWFKDQRVIYRIESLYNPSPGSKRINYIPIYHSIQKDVKNNQIRLIGPNAGYPRRGNGGPWIELRTK